MKIASVTVANATQGGAGLVHDVCLGAKKSTVATCTATATRNIPMGEASFFTQAVTTATVSKTA